MHEKEGFKKINLPREWHIKSWYVDTGMPFTYGQRKATGLKLKFLRLTLL